MITPPYLQKGDTVAIVCTARKFSLEEAQPAIKLLENWGLNVKLGNTIGLNNYQLGGSDEERAADFQAMLNDPEVKAIWCARGGYGTVRIIDTLDFSVFISQPKWIVGFSDITVLHNHVHGLGVQTLHALMPYSVPGTIVQAHESVFEALFGKFVNYPIPINPYNKVGQATGTIVGGNLSIISSLLGSPSTLNTRGKILFLEDLDEYLYHMDRMFYNLKRNGYFEHLSGLIIGGMTDMHDNEIPYGKNLEQIVLDICSAYSFPICFDFPAGHIPNNMAIRLGATVQLTVNETNVEVNALIHA